MNQKQTHKKRKKEELTKFENFIISFVFGNTMVWVSLILCILLLLDFHMFIGGLVGCGLLGGGMAIHALIKRKNEK